MNVSDFLDGMLEIAHQQLPPELSAFRVARPNKSLIKLHYGLPTTHYEVWIQKRTQMVELGLHFEGDSAMNKRQMMFFHERLDNIRLCLGPEVNAENWVKGWTRIHETIKLEPLNEDFLVDLSFKLSRMIRTLQPMIREL